MLAETMLMPVVNASLCSIRIYNVPTTKNVLEVGIIITASIVKVIRVLRIYYTRDDACSAKLGEWDIIFILP